MAVMLCTFDGETIYKVLDYSDSQCEAGTECRGTEEETAGVDCA